VRTFVASILPAETSTTMLHRKGNRSAELWFDQPGTGAERKSVSAVLAQYRTVRERNQNFVLNIALRSDGSIHPLDERVLRDAGQRLATAPRAGPPPAAGQEQEEHE
jgi:alpha-L-fucosidase